MQTPTSQKTTLALLATSAPPIVQALISGITNIEADIKAYQAECDFWEAELSHQ